MSEIRSKLKSQTGASISYALLLFLVCASLSAIILVAGTAAAGRLSKLAETDQRYYSVTSAAELITDLLDDQSVSVVTLSKGDNSVAVAFNKKMNEIVNQDFQEYDPYLGSSEEENDDSSGEESGEEVSDEPGEEVSDETENASDEDTEINPPINPQNSLAAELTSASAGEEFELSANDNPSLNVVVKVEEKIGSSVVLSIQDTIPTNGEGNKGHFKAYLKFSSNELNGKPPVTKPVEGYSIKSGKETTWNLVSMMTSYDR